MIDMGMRQYHAVDFSNWNREGSILLLGISPLPLEHATVKEDRTAIYTQNMAGARDLTGRSIEFNLQRLKPQPLRCAETGLSTVDHPATSGQAPTLPGSAH